MPSSHIVSVETLVMLSQVYALDTPGGFLETSSTLLEMMLSMKIPGDMCYLKCILFIINAQV